tara:strand:- start:388 stop:813 length:426 start_codon:yes stop_codon:yes gene_type:complete
MTSAINIFTCYTLVDITYTGVIRPGSDGIAKLKRNQQRNYETLLQIIGLRAQPMLFEKPYCYVRTSLGNFAFGSMYSENHNVWVLKFSVEHPGVFADGVNPFGLLLSDLSQVPVIAGLNETIDIAVPVFSTSLDFKNTYFI